MANIKTDFDAMMKMNIGSAKHIDSYFFSSRIGASEFKPLTLLDAIKIFSFPL